MKRALKQENDSLALRGKTLKGVTPSSAGKEASKKVSGVRSDPMKVNLDTIKTYEGVRVLFQRLRMDLFDKGVSIPKELNKPVLEMPQTRQAFVDAIRKLRALAPKG